MSGILTPPPASATPDLIKMDEPVEQVNTRPAPKLPAYSLVTSLGIQNQLNRAEIGKAVDIRVPSVALLMINSADRYKNGLIPYINPSTTPASAYGSTSTPGLISPYDFTIPASASVMNGAFTRIALTQFQMLYTVPFFNQKSDGLYITYKPASTGVATTYLINLYPTINYGYISFTSMLTALQLTIRTATGNAAFLITPVLAVSQGYKAVSNVAGDLFYFSRYVNPAYPNSKTLADYIGVAPYQSFASTQYGTANNTTYGTNYIDVVCEPITGNQLLRDSSTSAAGRTVLARIELQSENVSAAQPTANAQLVLNKTFPVPKWISWPANQPISQLRFQILDDTGTVLTCGPNYLIADGANNILGYNIDINQGDWNCVLQVSEL